MLNILLVAVGWLLPAISDISEREGLALANARTYLSRCTRSVPESPFEYGGGIDSAFPVGRADRMYQVAESQPVERRSPYPLVLISCWTVRNDRVHLEWKVWFKPTQAKPWKPFRPNHMPVQRPQGTLSLIAFSHEVDASDGSMARRFIVDPKSQDWKRARPELEARQTLICYDYADSLAPYYGAAYFIFPDGKFGDQLPEAEVLGLEEPLYFTRAERDMINARRRKK